MRRSPAIQCRNAAVGLVADLASVSKNEARSRCSTMPRTAGCCLIVLPSEPLDHALDRDFPGEPAQGVDTRVATDAQIHTVLLLNGRCECIAALQTQLAGSSISRPTAAHRWIVIT